MSERLKKLSDAGVSIWLDDLSRERLETGNLADLVKNSLGRRRHHQPVDLRGRARRGRTLRRTRCGELAADGADVDAAVFALDHHRRPQRLRRAATGLRRHRRRRRAGLDRGLPRPRPRLPTPPSPSARSSSTSVDRPNALHQDPGHARGLAGDHRGARRRHQRQCDADLRARAVRPGDGGLRRRPRAGAATTATTSPRSTRWRRSSSPASTPRSTSVWRRPVRTRR